MTDREFWQRVGEELQRHRLRRGLKSTNAVQTAGGPNYKTVASIEAGNIGELGSLMQYLQAIDLNMVDLFRSVLAIEPEEQSPELAFVVRQFKESGVKGRAAFVRLAELAEERQEPPSPAETRGPSETRQENTRANNGAAKPRGKK